MAAMQKIATFMLLMFFSEYCFLSFSVDIRLVLEGCKSIIF